MHSEVTQNQLKWTSYVPNRMGTWTNNLMNPHNSVFRTYSKLTLKMHFNAHCCCCWVASVVSNSVRPQRWQPTRFPHPWDSPGKNTGVGCHFLLQCMKVKSEREVTQSCPTLRDPMDRSPPDFSIHGISQARVPEWGAIAFSINAH